MIDFASWNTSIRFLLMKYEIIKLSISEKGRFDNAAMLYIWHIFIKME